jgi:hypothetical protein
LHLLLTNLVIIDIGGSRNWKEERFCRWQQ